ncbi:hypothetical protein HYX58_01010 [Candidatus Dependentiae bacterium]|nr:hypothetical protein [Candidatus Dependentiae bacterium]
MKILTYSLFFLFSANIFSMNNQRKLQHKPPNTEVPQRKHLFSFNNPAVLVAHTIYLTQIVVLKENNVINPVLAQNIIEAYEKGSSEELTKPYLF